MQKFNLVNINRFIVILIKIFDMKIISQDWFSGGFMKKIGFIVNLTKEPALKIAVGVVDYLQKHNILVYTNLEIPNVLPFFCYGDDHNKLCEPVDCILVLGGDGTLLNTARRVADKAIPILGINMGHLGFLTELEVDALYYGLNQLINGDYYIEQRMMLLANVYRKKKIVSTHHALNDLVITKNAFARLIELETYVNDQYLATYPADGLIISSPTGSTAYSLSAGGPIVAPDVEVIIVTPICPHTLHARPVVISPKNKVRVKIVSRSSEVMLTIDGQDGFPLEEADEIVLEQSFYKTKLIRLGNKSFYEVLREKLKDGGQKS